MTHADSSSDMVSGMLKGYFIGDTIIVLDILALPSQSESTAEGDVSIKSKDNNRWNLFQSLESL